KPANIMLCNEDETDHGVRLLDFGCARVTGEIKIAHTREGMYLGTPGYISPEAAAGLPVDGRADVFALGVILYRMITGQLPYPAGDAREALARVLDATPAPPLREHLPTGVLEPEEPPASVETL